MSVDASGLLFQRYVQVRHQIAHAEFIHLICCSEAKFFKLHERGDKVVWQRKATGEVTLSRDGSTGKFLLKIVRRSTAKLCASLMRACYSP